MRFAKFSLIWCEVPSPSPADTGSITAEWALTLPAVVIAFGMILFGASAFVSQSRLDHAAADASRMSSLGAPAPELQQHVTQLLGRGVSLGLRSGSRPDLICVELSWAPQAGVVGLIRPQLQSTSCALAPPATP